jgi:hypothetical protein
LQDLVADEVAARVVDRLEVIDISQQEHRAIAPTRSWRVHDDATVPQRGQWIVPGLEAHLLARLHQPILQVKDSLTGAPPRLGVRSRTHRTIREYTEHRGPGGPGE